MRGQTAFWTQVQAPTEPCNNVLSRGVSILPDRFVSTSDPSQESLVPKELSTTSDPVTTPEAEDA